MQKDLVKALEDAILAAGAHPAPSRPRGQPSQQLETPAARRARVLELREAIRAGKYHVSALDLADCLLDEPDLFS